MIFIEKSSIPIYDQSTNDPIYVFLQFFIPKEYDRYQEIKYSLRKNVENIHITQIILINERTYTIEELGIDSDKIIQHITGNRLTYQDFFQISQTFTGYHILINSDIELDDTIQKIRYSDLHLSKKIYWLLRYQDGQLFGNGRADSADTWIFHSAFPLTSHQQKAFKFNLGVPGCDNKVAYLFDILGYKIYNDPLTIKTHHHHANPERNYASTLNPPYMFIIPYQCEKVPYQLDINTVDTYTISTKMLYDYISSRKYPFVIPRISGVENIVACTQNMNYNHVMKNNAGIYLTSKNSIKMYSELYLASFKDCNIYASWEPWGHYIKHIGNTQDYILQRFKKKTFSAYNFDIFHSIHFPWTHALRGKRILIISPFIETFQKQSRTAIYGIDLFPECELVYIKPPQTQGTEPCMDWYDEYKKFCDRLYNIKDTFDIALCSCGGYANPICHYLYTIDKSAIYVGGVLQMYFGVYGNRWLKERPEVMKLYLNPEWKRPSPEETPSGASAIEGKCYW